MEDLRKDGIKQFREGKLKDNPYSVPEDYFDSFASKLQARIQTPQEPNHHWVWERLLRVMKPQVSLAVGIVLFAVIASTSIHFLLNKKSATQLPAEYAKVTEVDAFEYSDQHFIDILLEEEQAIRQKKLEKDAYIDYLVDEGIDYGTLIDEL